MLAVLSRTGSWAALIVGCCLSLPTPADAKPPVGPGAGAGTRKADPPGPRTVPAQPSATSKSKTSHKLGNPPRSPEPRLPDGAARAESDLPARRGVVDGPTTDESRKRLSDPELLALRDAERILFPKVLSGFSSGWTWADADASVQQQGLPPIVQALPSATHEDAVTAEWLRSLALPDFPVRFDARVVQYLKFYRDSKSGRAIARAWAKKIGRYSGAMQAELSRAGLPKDLVWVSLIESGHNPTAVSPAGAAGMWQFIPESGRMYGLTVDRWVDERLDPGRSTQAAAQYLGDLYQRFGAWELAMAAYNMGHGGMLRSVRKYNTNDFWRLSRYEAALPWETSLYVPKVFAIAIVMNNKRAFGLDDITPDPAISFDTVYVQAGVPLDDVAAASGIPVESLRSMNPEYQNGRVPPSAENDEKAASSPWPVKVPSGLGTKASAALAKNRHAGRHQPVIVRVGDTVQTIAERFHTSENALASLNGFKPNEQIVPGSVLLVPHTGAAPRADREEVVVIPEQSQAMPGRKRVFYRVLRGDTVTSVAHALRVSADELVLWNGLDDKANLQSGMTLQVFVPLDANLSQVRYIEADATRVVEAGTEPFVNYFEGLNGRKRITVVAKAGESLSSIGKRYGLSTGMMERINHFSRSRELKPGERVIVYAKLNQNGAEESDGKPLAQVEAPRPEALPDIR